MLHSVRQASHEKIDTGQSQLCEVPAGVRSLETESRMAVDRCWGRERSGFFFVVVHGYRASVLQEDKSSGDW